MHDGNSLWSAAASNKNLDHKYIGKYSLKIVKQKNYHTSPLTAYDPLDVPLSPLGPPGCPN